MAATFIGKAVGATGLLALLEKRATETPALKPYLGQAVRTSTPSGSRRPHASSTQHPPASKSTQPGTQKDPFDECMWPCACPPSGASHRPLPALQTVVAVPATFGAVILANVVGSSFTLLTLGMKVGKARSTIPNAPQYPKM
jgi:hypothetical protein